MNLISDLIDWIKRNLCFGRGKKIDHPEVSESLPPGVSEPLPPGVSEPLPPEVSESLPPGVSEPLPPEVSEPLPPEVSESLPPGVSEPLPPEVSEPLPPEVSEPPPPEVSEPPPPEVSEPPPPEVSEPPPPEVSEPPPPEVSEPPTNDIGSIGRRLEEGKNPSADGKHRKKVKPSLAHLICKEIGGQWKIAIAIDDSQEKKPVEVRHGENSLKRGSDGCYVVSEVGGEVVVEYNVGSDERIKIPDGKQPMIFKMRKNWQGDGQKVKSLSNGYYIVFASEKDCGKRINDEPPSPPGQTIYSDLQAHYFFVSSGGMEKDGFKKCSCASSKQQFELKGNEVHDHCAMGNLFVGEPPDFSNGENQWDGVALVSVGRENGGRLLTDPYPPGTKELKNVLQDNCGWFFVRFYDKENGLIHSMDFRYFRNLKAILINGEKNWHHQTIVPCLDGHKDVVIQFDGDDMVVENSSNSIQKTGNNTFAAPPLPENDATIWRLKDEKDKGDVRVEITLPRVWWRLSGDEKYTDKPIELSHQDFSKQKFKVRLPKDVSDIHAGFGKKSLPLKKTKDENFVNVSLSHFKDFEEVEEPPDSDLYLNLFMGEENFPVIRIPAEKIGRKPLPPEFPCPIKKSGKPCKGFSIGELESAGVYAIIRRNGWSIRIDCRRKSEHLWNISALKQIMETTNAF